LKEVYFNFNRADIRADARATLKSNAAWLKANPAVRAQIEGHCDERGTTDYNMALGAKRAQAVKDYLVNMGIPAARLSTISYGKEAPVCKETSESCWQRNRRGRFVITAGAPGS
jgi:peptidoglycan-associated lipoprotein